MKEEIDYEKYAKKNIRMNELKKLDDVELKILYNECFECMREKELEYSTRRIFNEE